MSKFNIGDKIISKGYPNLGAEVGVIVGIDPGKDAKAGKYFVKFDSLDINIAYTSRIPFHRYKNEN